MDNNHTSALRAGAVAAAEREVPRSAKRDALAKVDEAVKRITESRSVQYAPEGSDTQSLTMLRIAVEDLVSAVRALCDAVPD